MRLEAGQVGVCANLSKRATLDNPRSLMQESNITKPAPPSPAPGEAKLKAHRSWAGRGAGREIFVQRAAGKIY
jgi:hypothetical protein